MNKKFLVLGILAGIVATGWSVSVHEKPERAVVASGHPEWAPIMYRDGNTISGAGPALVKKIFDELGIQTAFPYTGTWDEVQAKAQAGEVDVLVAAYKTEERLGYMEYSTAYTTDPVAIFTRSNRRFDFDENEEQSSFTQYLAEAPRVDSLVPDQGPVAGGTEVIIQGEGFGENGLPSPFDVGFGGIPATEIQWISSQEIRVTAPPSPNGYVPLTVTTSSGRGVGEFFYYPPPLASIAPGQVTTVAGIGRYLGEGRPAVEVPVYPQDVTLDDEGNLYMVEPAFGVVRKVRPDGIVERYAGIGGDFAGEDIGEGGAALDATLVFPEGVTFGPDGDIYISDSFNHRIRKVDHITRMITTVAGSGPNGTCCLGEFGGDGGMAVDARLNMPCQVAFDNDGNMFILDSGNQRIRKVDRDGIITTIAGTGEVGFSGDNGPAVNAVFNFAHGSDTGVLKTDSEGNLYILDEGNNRIRKIDAETGIITTIAGGGLGSEDGLLATELDLATFLRGFTLDDAGGIYFGDNSRIRYMAPTGIVTTVFGSPNMSGVSPDGTLPAEGRLSNVNRMDVAADGTLYFIEFSNQRVRKLVPESRAVFTVAGTSPQAFGENGPALAAFLDPDSRNMAVTPGNEIVFGGGSRLRRLERSGILRTLAGGEVLTPFLSDPDDIPVFGASVLAGGVAVDAGGDIYISGAGVQRVRTDGILNPLTDNEQGFSGDGGPARQARLDDPIGLAVHSNGDIYIADSLNHRIRRIEAATGLIDTIAGTAPPHPPQFVVQNPSTGDGGPALQAELNLPNDVALDLEGNVYVPDSGRIRKIDSSGNIQAELSGCFGLLRSGRDGDVYAFCNNAFIRLDGTEQSTVIATIPDEPADLVPFGFISGFAIDDFGDLYFNAVEQRRIRVIKGVLPPRPSAFFPQIANGAGASSSLILTNPASGGTVAGEVQLLNPGGNVIEAGLSGSSELSIPPLGSITLQTDGAGELTTGSARLSVNGPLGGIVRFHLPGIGSAAVEAVFPAAGFATPVQSTGPGGFASGVAIMNLMEDVRTLDLSLRDANGVLMATAARELPAHGQFAAFVHELFPDVLPPGDFQGVLTARVDTASGKGTIAAVALELGSQPGELTTLPVTVLDDAYLPSTLRVAQFANGDGAHSDVLILNPSSANPVAGRIDFFGENGDPLSVGIEGRGTVEFVEFNLPPLGMLSLKSDGLGNVTAGSVKVTADGPVGGSVRFSIPGIGIAGVGAGVLSDQLIVPVRRDVVAGNNSGVALVNAGDPASVTLILRNPQGQEVPGGRRVLEDWPANAHLAQFIQELFPDADTASFEGTVTMTAGDASGSLAATALELGSGYFTALPVTRIR